MTDSKQLSEAFTQAVYDKNFGAAESLLSQGADVNYANVKGQTPFIFYVADNQLETAEWLKQHGADVNAQDRSGKSALHYLVESAILTRKYDQLTDLLAWRPNLDLTDRQGRTALSIASFSSKSEGLVSMLLDAGADPNIASIHGVPPLLGAVANGYEATAIALLSHGADPNQTDNEGRNLWHALALSTSKSLASKLTEYQINADVNLKSKAGATPLAIALDSGNLSLVETLLKNNADPNVQSTNRFSMGATCLQNLILFSDEGEEDDSSKNNQKPSGSAVVGIPEHLKSAEEEAPALPAINLAIDAGADVFASDKYGRNAWHYLALRSKFSKEIFDLLLKAGLPTDEPSGPAGANPLSALFLQRSSPYYRQQNMKYMLDAGFPADPPFLGKSTVPTSLSSSSVKSLPLAGSVNVSTNPSTSASPRGTDRSGNAQEHDTDFYENQKNNLLLSPLSLAVLTRSRFEADLLLQAGADPNKLDSSGCNPLLHAVTLDLDQNKIQLILMLTKAQKIKDPEAEVAKLQAEFAQFKHDLIADLLNHQADPSFEFSETATKVTPFLATVSHASSQTVWQLIQAGADPMKPNSVGDYGVQQALNNGRLELFYGLVDYVKKQGKESANKLKEVLLDSLMTSPEDYQKRVPYLEVLRTVKDPSWLNYQDADGNTPLMVAAATDQEDVVKILLANGADPNLANKVGETPLMHAVLNEKSDIIEALRAFEADPTIKTPQGQTLTELANASHLRHVVNALLLDPSDDAKSSIVAFGKPHKETKQAIAPKQLKQFIEDWQKPMELSPVPEPAEPPELKKDKQDNQGNRQTIKLK